MVVLIKLILDQGQKSLKMHQKAETDLQNLVARDGCQGFLYLPIFFVSSAWYSLFSNPP